MRRTYRSKKDTGDVLDRRDFLLNSDAKSSAYDAFFIHNIKQTKRELSCIGSSNAHGVASNRVRKKKYVKRIVKVVETPCQESSSRSAYLTPDKSIRVNKPMDPFDMLLNSSPPYSVEVLQPKTESVTNKVGLIDNLVQKKEGRTYTRRKPVKAKKVLYSSNESSDSDKENSDEQINGTQNTSDIKAYQLLIENANYTPKMCNDSINNIVNNLSLLNKLKHKNSFNESMKRPLSYYKNRLTRNIQSPMLQKSPLCSTPFKAKYRGESIYNLSPILITNDDNSPKCTSITEDNDNGNNSIVFLGNNKTPSPRDLKENAHITAEDVIPNNSIKCDIDNEELTPEIATSIEHEVFHKGESKEQNVNSKLVNNINSTPNVEISSFQTTESEPFFGFTNNTNNEIITEDKSIQRLSYLDKVSRNNVAQIKANANCNNTEENSLYNASTDANNEKEENTSSSESLYDGNNSSSESVNDDNNSLSESVNDDSNSSSESVNDDNNSLYDTCTSDQNSIEEKERIKEPIVQITKMNDSSFLRYYEKMHDYSIEVDDTAESLKHEETDENDDSLQNQEIFGENNVSFEEEILSEEEEFASFKNSDVTIETDENDDSLQNKKNDENDVSLEEEIISHEEEFASFKNNDVTNEDISENGSDLEVDVEKDNNILENEAGGYFDVILSNDDDDGDSNEVEYVSFVTTRRRNKVIRNSVMSIFNDSFASSSTDCNKTVLSNNRLTGNIDVNEVGKENENDTLMDLNIDEQVNSYTEALSKDVEHPEILSDSSSDCQDKEDTRISFVTARDSNITDRKSSLRNRKSSINLRRNTTSTRRSSKLPRESTIHSPEPSRTTCFEKPGIVLQPGKKWERSLSIYRRITMMTDHYDQSILEDGPIDKKGRKYRQSVISTMEMQELNGSLHNESINSRRSTFVSKPSRSTIRIVKDPDISRLSLCNTTVFDDLKGFLNEECDDTIIELSKLSIADQTREVTVLDTFHDTSSRIATARDYVLRRCNQADAILFDECYPDTVLKNCHKIGEGVYGEVFLWRDREGRARVLKIVPIAGSLKVNGESQKDFQEIISEIVIAMELSALRAPIAEINRHFDEGKDVEALDLHSIENATDIFNEVLAVRCVYGSYPARLLDLWDLYDECKGSENDNPAILPVDQQFIVLELANAGQDLESYQFNNAEQAYALFMQVAYGLAVAEEAFQFEHRDLHWGNVLIAPTEEKYSTFVIRGRSHRVPRRGVAATIIDYSLSRVSLPLAGGESAALYNDLAADDSLFDAVGDYQFEVYRLMRDKLGNEWKNFAPYTNILWLHYTVDKMITALRYKRTNTKVHKHYIEKLKGIKSRILDYGSAALFVLTDNEI